MDPLYWRAELALKPYGYSEQNPLLLSDSFGLCSRCDDCPSGTWTYLGLSSGFAFVGGIAGTRGFYQCDGKPMLNVKVHALCGVIGYALWLGADFTTAGIPGACGCSARDLLGKKWSFFFGGGPLSKSFTSCFDRPLGAGLLGVAFSTPLSGGALVCRITRR